jgi:TRAP-type transport system periplasmic protein
MKLTKTLMAVFAATTLCAGTSAAQGQDMKLRLGHVGDPADPRHTACEKFAEIAKKESGGKIDVRIFPSSSLGDYKQMQEGLQQGTIDIVIESIGTLSRFYPPAGVESMPYLFDGYDHYVSIWNGPVGEKLKKDMAEKANFLILGHMFRGARELTSNKPVRSIDDLKGLKIRVSPMKERLVTWKTFGANPTPMGFSEVFTALQQGVIDAQENPLETIKGSSLFEVQKYLILTSHMANGFTFMFNAKRFNAWPAEIQAAIRKAADGGADWYNKFVADEASATLAFLKERGMEIIEPDRAPFRAKAKAVVDEFPELKELYLQMVR